jgi:hypothetical protein
MKKYLFTIVAIAILLTINTVSRAELVTGSADLPPNGAYISPDEYFEYHDIGLDIILDNPVLDQFTNIYREAVGNDEMETFDAVFTANEIDQGLGLITFTGPVQVLTTDRLLGTTGLFDAEIVSMSLSSGSMMIREDPDFASTGQTEITDLGGGLYQIDSFFDVYTEFSPDGGSNWYDSDVSTYIYLVPEPATIALLSVGCLALLRKRRS